MPVEQWFEDLYGIEYTADPGPLPRWFEIERQVASGSEEFRKVGSVFSVDSGNSELEIREQILTRIKTAAERHPDIKFKAVEVGAPVTLRGYLPPEEPDWRRPYEECFGDISIQWNTGMREFWALRQAERGSDEFVFTGSIFSWPPGVGEEAILDRLRSHADWTREHEHLKPGIKFKFVEADPAFVPLSLQAQLEALGVNAKPETAPEPPRPELEIPGAKIEPRLARCKQCDHVFLKNVIQGLPAECERCGATVAWELIIPEGSQNPATSDNVLHADQLKFFTGQSFERFLKILFERIGFSVEGTPTTTDQGADLILMDPAGRRIAVQAKRYNQDVGNAAVQEILGGMAYWGCSLGIVISASGFTRAAKDLASKAPAVILWDRSVLEVLIHRYMSEVVIFVAERQPSSGT